MTRSQSYAGSGSPGSTVNSQSYGLPRRLIDPSRPWAASNARYASDACCLSSIGRRNSRLSRSERLVKHLSRYSPAKRLPWSRVERHGHGSQRVGTVQAQVGPFRKILLHQPVRVLVRAALPRAVRIAKVDAQPGVDRQLRMLRHRRLGLPLRPRNLPHRPIRSWSARRRPTRQGRIQPPVRLQPARRPAHRALCHGEFGLESAWRGCIVEAPPYCRGPLAGS